MRHSGRCPPPKTTRCFAFLFGLILLSAVRPAIAQVTAPVPKSLQGFDRFAAAAMAEIKAPGLAVAVVQGGRLIYAQGFGFRDLERKLPVTPHTIFGIGSCSKAFTATTMGMLVDEG